MSEPGDRREGSVAEEATAYTRPRMEGRAVGRQGQLDAAGRRSGEPGSQASEQVRALVQSLVEGSSGTTGEDVLSQMSMVVLEAQEQERSRLAEELHDGPAQALANAIFQTEILDRALREPQVAGDKSAHSELVQLRQILERELDRLRGYINQLRPSLDEAEELDEALRDSALAVSQRSRLPIEVTFGATSEQLQDAARIVVLRVAQEALRNIAKHSGASRAWMVTRTIDEPGGGHKWQLEVGDDGRGFDIDGVTAHPNRRHFGLRFMRERADLLGSELSITTSPAAGTVVRLTTDIGG